MLNLLNLQLVIHEHFININVWLHPHQCWKDDRDTLVEKEWEISEIAKLFIQIMEPILWNGLRC